MVCDGGSKSYKPINKPSKPDVSRYLASVNEHNFKQYVNGPTHKFGNTLDHVICHEDDDLLVSCVVSLSRYGSDHHIIQCQVNRSKPPPERRSFTTRCYKDLDIDIFKSDLVGAIQPILCTDDPNSQAELYNKSIQEVLDKHCPEKTRSQKLVRNPKWYTDDVMTARRERRQCERRWRKTRSNEDRRTFLEQNDKVNNMIKENKTAYFKETLENSNAKTMYKTLNVLLNTSVQKLPASVSNVELSNRFASFFTEKVCKIRSELDQTCNSVQSGNDGSKTSELDQTCNTMQSGTNGCKTSVISNVSDNVSSVVNSTKCNILSNDYNGTQPLQCFSYVNEEEVTKIIANLPNKNSPLDPMPTWLLKRCADTLSPIIMSIINNSFRVGIFPQILRQAVISPLIKKPTLDPDVLKNYRPVSNLPTLGKIIEYPVVSRLKQHLQENNLTEIHQSAYKCSHSTETALLKVKNDMLQELDKGKSITLVLLDLSSAFDMIDHDIPIDRMQKEFGVTGSAIDLLTSYLKDRTTKVCVLGEYSKDHALQYGVPQGSIAGPPIFTAYAQPVANIIRRFQIGYHIYADDTQLYVSFDPKSEEDIAEI